MQARSLWRSGAVALVAGLALTAQGRADPLPKEACEAVGLEHAKLTEAGLPELVKKGPDWVKANLGEARMQEVARYIKVHEELLFRCGFDKAKALPGTGGDETSDERTAAVAAPPLPQRKPAVPESFRARPIPAAAGSKAQAATAARSQSKPQPKRRPKADDAYRPPAKAPATE